MCFTIRHQRDESRELQGLGQRLGSCNVSSRTRLGLGSEGLVHIPVSMIMKNKIGPISKRLSCINFGHLIFGKIIIPKIGATKTYILKISHQI